MITLLKKFWWLFLLVLAFIIMIFIPSARAVEYGPGTTFYNNTFDTYDVDEDMPNPPFSTFGTNGDIPVIVDEQYFGPPGNRSVHFVSGSSDIDRFKVQVDEASALYSSDFRGFFYVASGVNDNALVFARGLTSAQQSIICVASTQTCTIEGHTIVDDFTYDAWHFFDLQWDFDANTITGCIDSDCYGPHTPSNALDTDNDYAMVYQTTGALRDMYVDCLGCSYDFVEQYTQYIPISAPTETPFSQYISMFQTKFPFATIDFLYDYFVNLTLPDVPSPSLSATFFGVSVSLIDTSMLTNISIPIPGTENTITLVDLIRDVFILVLWFAMVEFIIWWFLKIFGH